MNMLGQYQTDVSTIQNDSREILDTLNEAIRVLLSDRVLLAGILLDSSDLTELQFVSGDVQEKKSYMRFVVKLKGDTHCQGPRELTLGLELNVNAKEM